MMPRSLPVCHQSSSMTDTFCRKAKQGIFGAMLRVRLGCSSGIGTLSLLRAWLSPQNTQGGLWGLQRGRWLCALFDSISFSCVPDSWPGLDTSSHHLGRCCGTRDSVVLLSLLCQQRVHQHLPMETQRHKVWQNDELCAPWETKEETLMWTSSLQCTCECELIPHTGVPGTHRYRHPFPQNLFWYYVDDIQYLLVWFCPREGIYERKSVGSGRNKSLGVIYGELETLRGIPCVVRWGLKVTNVGVPSSFGNVSSVYSVGLEGILQWNDSLGR